MCKPTHDEKRVLAAETFFHSYQASRENTESVVNFDTPVNFTEIKILSPSMYFSTENGGFMLGATEPTHFPIQFFCNNIHRPTVTTYEDLGTMDYDENIRTKFKCSTNIWADKLIVSGRFSAITVIVYGSPKDDDIEDIQKRDRTCNLPLFPLSNGGVPDIMALANNQYLDPNLTNGLSNLQLDSNYF